MDDETYIRFLLERLLLIHNLTILQHSERMRQIHQIEDEALGHEV